MLIKISERQYISREAISKVCIFAEDSKIVRIFGRGIKFYTICKTPKEAVRHLEKIVRMIGNNENDLSMYEWEEGI